MILVPDGYGTRLIPLEESYAKHARYAHPDFIDPLFAAFEAQGGFMGIGGGFRADGDQPDLPGFAPEGLSFHQRQRFASGKVVYSAVDLVVRNDAGLFKRIFTANGARSNPETNLLTRMLTVSAVHRSPTWAETEFLAEFNLHTFIRSPKPEPWHAQAINIRGHGSWVAAGRPDPIGWHPTPDPLPIPTPEEDDMKPTITYWQGEDPGWLISIAYDVSAAKYVWSSIDGFAAQSVIDAGLAHDGRQSPLSQRLKNSAKAVQVK